MHKFQWLELRIPPPLLALAFVGLMCGLVRNAPLLPVVVPAGLLLANLLAAAGASAALFGAVSLAAAKTTINPMAPGATSALVVTGIYGLSRNPMYLGVVLVLTGLAVFLADLSAFVFPALFVLYINRFQIGPEERILVGVFGDRYRAYAARVRRWV